MTSPTDLTGGFTDGTSRPLPPPIVDEPAPLFLDTLLPIYDAVIVAETVVDAPTDTVWGTARDFDFLSVHTPLLDAAMWVRGLPDRVTGKQIPVPPRLALADGGLPGWSVLGEDPAREIAFGAVGRFWTPTIEWRDVSAADFPSFAEPGWGKIACAFVTLPYGTHRTILTYECRTAISDERSRRRFANYWRLIRPFVSHIMGATVRTLRVTAERNALL